MGQKKALRLPVVAEGAEHLVIGYLMRRNILTFKAPRSNEGYDLLCTHPNPKKVTKQIRVQVKSRYASDSNRTVTLKERTFDAFDYLVIVFQNIGYYYRAKPTKSGLSAPEFYTLPRSFVKKHHIRKSKSWEVFRTKDLNLEPFRDEAGFEQIARDLHIAYPKRKA